MSQLSLNQTARVALKKVTSGGFQLFFLRLSLGAFTTGGKVLLRRRSEDERRKLYSFKKEI